MNGCPYLERDHEGDYDCALGAMIECDCCIHGAGECDPLEYTDENEEVTK